MMRGQIKQVANTGNCNNLDVRGSQTICHELVRRFPTILVFTQKKEEAFL
jgi:recombinational DNA repair protein RecR